MASGDGAKFPAAPFNCTVWPANVQPISTNAEIVRVTNVTGDVFTITRAQESSSARSIGVGDQIANSITAKVLTDTEVQIINGGGTVVVNSDGSVSISPANGVNANVTTGFLGIGATTFTPLALLHSWTGAISQKAAILQGTGGQTANLLEFQTSTNVAYGTFNLNGTPNYAGVAGESTYLPASALFTVGLGLTPGGHPGILGVNSFSSTDRAGFYIGDTTTGFYARPGSQSDIRSYWTLVLNGNHQGTQPTNLGSNPGSIGVLIENHIASSIAQVVRGASSQSGDLIEWQNSSGSPLLGVNPNGQIVTGTAGGYLFDVTYPGATSAAFRVATHANDVEGLRIIPVGTSVQFTTVSTGKLVFAVNNTAAGTIQWWDFNGGVVMDMGATIASTVNGLRINGAATGNYPVLNVQGGDSAIGLALQAKSASNQLAVNDTIAAASKPLVQTKATDTITGAVTDAFTGGLELAPTINAATAQTVTRLNYINVLNAVLGGAGPAAVTDAAVLRFDANAGTHKAVDAGTTKTTPGTVNAWVKININGTIYYLPAYTSKTT